MRRYKKLIDSRRARWLTLLTAALMVAATELIVWELDRQLSEQARNNLVDEAAEGRVFIQSEISEGIYITVGLTSFISSQQGQEVLDDIIVWMNELFAITPHLRNIGIAPDNVIRAIFPVEGNEAAIGMDYRTLPNQWPAVQTMMRTGEPTLVGPITLIQGGQGVIYRRPVFVDGDYWGLVSTVLNYDTLRESYDRHFADRDIDYHLEQLGSQGRETIAGISPGYRARQASQEITFPGDTRWQLTVYEQASVWPAWLARVALLSFFAMLGLVVWQRRLNRHYQRGLERRSAEDKLQFISTVSHELRTPLTSIGGSLKLLHARAAGELPEPASRMVDIAYRNALRMEALINDVLDITRLESRQFVLKLEPQSLTPLLETAVENIQAFASRYNTTLELALGNNPPAQARVDADRFLQVMDNLLSNAIKFSPENSRVQVVLDSGECEHRIRVIDQGQGIPEAFRERIFQRFAQADNADNRTQQAGTGLGLSIVKELVERMDGRIEVESEPGKGSCFQITLPACAPHAD